MKRSKHREMIYDVIDTERHYQEIMKADPSRPEMVEQLSVGETISAIQHNLDLARKEWYKGANPHHAAMVYLRKIAALCVQAGEEFGMPSRVIL